MGPVQEVWTDFERAVNRHLDAEDEILLPRLERRHPDDVRRIRDEHAEIRRLVLDLGIRADLRTLRRDVADDLVRKLEDHSAREESGIYAWADQELSEHRAGLFDRLAARATRIV